MTRYLVTETIPGVIRRTVETAGGPDRAIALYREHVQHGLATVENFRAELEFFVAGPPPHYTAIEVAPDDPDWATAAPDIVDTAPAPPTHVVDVLVCWQNDTALAREWGRWERHTVRIPAATPAEDRARVARRTFIETLSPQAAAAFHTCFVVADNGLPVREDQG